MLQLKTDSFSLLQNAVGLVSIAVALILLKQYYVLGGFGTFLIVLDIVIDLIVPQQSNPLPSDPFSRKEQK